MQEAAGEIGRPRHCHARLEVVFIPVVHRLAAIHRARATDNDRGSKVGALGGCVQALLEISAERHRGLHFKTVRLVDRAFQAIAKTQGKGEVRTELPRIHEVSFIGLRGEVPRTGRSGRQQFAVLIEGEVGGVLREPADDRRARVLYCRNSGPIQSVDAAGQVIRGQEILEGAGDVITRTQIKRGVGDCIVKRIREADAPVADRAEVESILENMFSVGP